HLHLFTFLPAQVAVVAQDEKGAEVRAAHERAAREIERNETERSAHERVADGATALDEGSKPARRMFAFADSDAVSVCALQRDHDLDRFSPGIVSLDSRSVRAISLHPRHRTHSADPLRRFDDRLAVAFSAAFGCY